MLIPNPPDAYDKKDQAVVRNELERADRLNVKKDRPFDFVPYLPSYTKTTLPDATRAAGLIYVTNDTGGAVPAFSDGTNWRRVTDRAIIA